jgi:ABC-2 type transport system ATP-binding protein
VGVCRKRILPQCSAASPTSRGCTSAASGRYKLAVRHPEQTAPAVARAPVGAAADILSLSESRRSLESVYLSLIDEDVEVRRR